MFFSHMVGSLDSGVLGVFKSHGLCKGFSFCFAICHCLTCPYRWSTLELRWNYSLAIFCVIVRQLCSYVNKGQAVWFGLAWLPVVCEKSISWSWCMLGNNSFLFNFSLTPLWYLVVFKHNLMLWMLLLLFILMNITIKLYRYVFDGKPPHMKSGEVQL